jgi:hypothetical protein
MSLFRRDPQIRKREARDLLERRRRHLAARCEAARLVDDHGDEELRRFPIDEPE